MANVHVYKRGAVARVAPAAKIQPLHAFYAALVVKIAHGCVPVCVYLRAVVCFAFVHAADAAVFVGNIERAAACANIVCLKAAPYHIRGAHNVVFHYGVGLISAFVYRKIQLIAAYGPAACGGGCGHERVLYAPRIAHKLGVHAVENAQPALRKKKQAARPLYYRAVHRRFRAAFNFLNDKVARLIAQQTVYAVPFEYDKLVAQRGKAHYRVALHAAHLRMPAFNVRACLNAAPIFYAPAPAGKLRPIKPVRVFRISRGEKAASVHRQISRPFVGYPLRAAKGLSLVPIELYKLPLAGGYYQIIL